MRVMRDMGFMRCTYISSFVLAGVLCCGWLNPASVNAQDKQVKQIVCLDPGHQLHGNNELEPAAPNSQEMKAKVSSGTSGVKTGKPEYVLTLEASQLLRDKLTALGYEVVMTRESHDVDISNVERAQRCNEVQADLAVRIHADGDDSSRTQGISLLYPAKNEGTQAIYATSKDAAGVILQETVAATGANYRGTVPRSDLTGFNWSKVPSVLVEMGFMTNPEEDDKLSDADYLNQLTQGIADGINLALALEVNGDEVKAQTQNFLPGITRLFELSNGKMIRTPLALSPQTLQVSATRGNWGKVNTWVGERWVYLGQAPIQVKPVDKLIELSGVTSLYRTPVNAEAVAQLAPQKVHAIGQWNEWYLIESWLGKVWLTAGE